MIVPCMVNSWLYCSGVRNCIPGRASSARMNRAIRPPIMNQVNEVAMYMTPRTFGSVVCRYCRNFAPRGARWTGYGRVTTGRGATAVKIGLQRVEARTCRGQTRDESMLVRRCVEHRVRGARRHFVVVAIDVPSGRDGEDSGDRGPGQPISTLKMAGSGAT